MSDHILDGSTLTLDDVAAVAGGEIRVALSPDALAKMAESRVLVDKAVQDSVPVYGVTTGLGARAGETLDAETLVAFSEATIRGRAHAVGEYVPQDVTRATLLARLNGLLTGFSGARPEIAEFLRDVINSGWVPRARGIGSIGAGDLVINASMARTFLGEAQMIDPSGSVVDASVALKTAGLGPLQLAPRDGLALINHTGFSTGFAALTLARAQVAFDWVQAATALSYEGFRANLAPLNETALSARPLPGQNLAADGLRAWLDGSALWDDGAARRLQDPLSLRNAVHIHGGLARALDLACGVVETELNASSDSPVCLVEDGKIVSAGGYHTTELGLALEAVSRAWVHVAMAQVARIARFMEPDLTDLPLFLARPDSGSNGFAPLLKVVEDLAMSITQAAAPLPVWPSINARGIEDALTTAPAAPRALDRLLSFATRLTAAELIVASQAVDLRDGIVLGSPMTGVMRQIRGIVAMVHADRPLGEELEALAVALSDPPHPIPANPLRKCHNLRLIRWFFWT